MPPPGPRGSAPATRLRDMAGRRLLRARPAVGRAAEKLLLAQVLGVRSARQAVRSRRKLSPLGDAARNAAYAEMWSASAAAVGATYQDLGGGLGQVRRGQASTRVFQQVTMLDDAVSLRRALRHHDLHAELRGAGLQLPEAVLFTPEDLTPALDLISRTGPCVVKPAHGAAGGDGVTVGVGPRELPLAVVTASRFAGGLTAEQQVSGYLFRVLLLDGEVVDVIRDDVPHVVGDGRSSVVQLMAAENTRREEAFGRRGLSYWEFDLDTALTLARRGRRGGDVPAPGEQVAVKSVTNDRRLEDSITWHRPLHPSVLREVRSAAAVVGLRLSGVDVVAPDLDRPLADSGGALLEVNGAPGIHRHYQVRDRAAATDVAAVILGQLLD